jgi:hypothetical protein
MTDKRDFMSVGVIVDAYSDNLSSPRKLSIVLRLGDMDNFLELSLPSRDDIFECEQAIAKVFGKSSFTEMLNTEAIGLFACKGELVGLMDQKTGKKFIADRWISDRFGTPLVSPKEVRRQKLLRKIKRCQRSLEQAKRDLEEIDLLTYEWEKEP